MQRTKPFHTPILILGLLLATLAGCKGGAPQAGEDRAEEEDTTTLRVGTLSQSISYYEKGEKIVGYEYETVEDFAKSINKQTRYVLGKDENDLVQKVKRGEVDVVAYPIVMSNENRQQLNFTDHTYITHQVLVQRKDERAAEPKKKKGRQKKNAPPTTLVRDVTQLIGKEVWVMKGTKHEERLRHLNDEIGGGIIIRACGEEEDEEDLIDKVSKKVIDFTVCDEKVARANTAEYTNIDLATNVSFDQRAAWAVKDTALLKAVNKWTQEKKTAQLIKHLHLKYFDTRHYVSKMQRVRITKIPKGSHEISNYDPYFKQFGEENGFDWRLIAAVTFKESRFHPEVVGWNGSIGLMQLMPVVGRRFGVGKDELFDPEVNIKTGCQCLKLLYDSNKNAETEDDRIRLSLACYNAGMGHIKDAQALARKYGKNPYVWKDNVEVFVRLKSNKQYYRDPVVKHGYMSGNNVCNYVATIMAQYEEYKDKFEEKKD